jgi:hypothetical protein
MRTGYCIFIDTLCDGSIPAVHDAQGKPCVFATRVEAEREIADNLITRLQEFIDGERDFDDAKSIEERVVEVIIRADGSIMECVEGKRARPPKQ